MKNYKYLIIFCAFFSQSCEDYLEENLVSGVSAGSFYITPSGFEAAVAATYAELKPFYGQERGFTTTVFGTDLYTNGRGGSHKMLNFYDGAFSPAEPMIRDTWRDFYRGINQANAVINRSTSLTNVSEQLKSQRIAEVRFLRALYYFNLVRFFGDIHLSLEETVGVEITAERTPAGQIYLEAIIPDLEYAIENLPAVQPEYGRVTKPAAQFLLAQVYLTRSYQQFGNGDSDAREVTTLISSVINDYNFSLLSDYGSLWDINNEKNPEVIFAVQNNKNQVDEQLDTFGHRGHLFFLMEYDIVPGMRRDTENGRPWIRFKPTAFLLSLWDREVDSRYDKSCKHVWYSNNVASIPRWTSNDASNGYVSANLVGQPKFSLGDTAIFLPGPGKNSEWTADKIGKAPYFVVTERIYDERYYPTLKKWIDPTRPNRQHVEGQRDHPLMRLAEAHLLRAEANIILGNLTGAAEDINAVRRRGAWPGMESEIQINSSEVSLDFLLDERARELVGEGQRWFDLARTGKLIERVRLHNPEGKLNIQEFHILRPIPLEQIDRTEGGYRQNCGYIGADC